MSDSVRRLGPALAALVVLVALLAAARADAAGWTLTRVDRIPQRYYQGLAHAPDGWLFFTGIEHGAYRTTPALRQDRALDQAIPPELGHDPGLNHIGDPGWLGGAGGSLVLPLECYTIGAPNGGNTCGRGAFALLDGGLRWRSYFLLDPAEIAKAMWAEVSPDGSLIWTSSGRDLLAYRTADLVAANAGPLGGPLRAAVRLPGAVPPSGVTGAAFHDGRLYLAGQDTGPFQVWSLDVGAPAPYDEHLEIQRDITGESEGLDAFTGLGGELHWIISPLTFTGRAPTYGAAGNVLLTFAPGDRTSLRLVAPRVSLRAGRPASLDLRVLQTLGGREVPAAGARVSAGRWSARAGDDGRVTLRVRPLTGGTLSVRAALQELAAPPVALRVLPAIGLPLTSLPSAEVGAGGRARRVRATRFLDCSGPSGCEGIPRTPRLSGCLAARGGAPIRVRLLRRPARSVQVLIERGGRTVDAGRATATGRSALGWRFTPDRALPSKSTLTLIAVYPDGTGALSQVRLRTGGC